LHKAVYCHAQIYIGMENSHVNKDEMSDLENDIVADSHASEMDDPTVSVQADIEEQ